MKKTYLLGAMLMGLFVTGCTSDDLQVGESQISEKDQTFYISMKIMGDNVDSRAAGDNGTPIDPTDFEDGTVNGENEVNNAYFVFYDTNGNVVGDIVPVDLDDLTLDAELDPTGATGTIEKSYKSVIPVSVRKGERKPSQVICYINPIQPSSLQNPLNAIQTTSRTSAWSTVGGENTKYFAMSNSVYYANQNATTPTIAAQIPETNLYTTQAAAEAALGSNNTVNIYVERYATKLKFSAADPEPYKTNTRVYNPNSTTSTTVPVTLSFKPQYWAVNAESNRTYVIKSFRQESALGEILANNYSWAGLNAFINPSEYDDANSTWTYPALGTDAGSYNVLDNTNRWAWNAPTYHRSYWGMSPAYFTAAYPEVSSDLADMKANNQTINQKYISYNELATPNNGIGFEATNTSAQYFRETTVGSTALNSKNPNAAVASVIYVGEYDLTLNGTALPAGTSFYTYLAGPVADVEGDRPYVYFENQEGSCKSAVSGGESMLLRFFAQNTILYRESTEAEKAAGAGDYTRLSIERTNDINMMTDALSVSVIGDNVKIAYDGDKNTKLKIQNNARTLQFNNAEDASGIFIVDAGGYMQIVPDNTENIDPNTQVTLTRANLVLMRQVGVSYYYKTGHAYFSIPVKHFGWYRNGNEQKNDTKINWNIVRVGDFGMVRNHSYTVKVNQILGLASGIGDDDNPIVPPANTEDYFLAYSVNILKWAVVPVQNVNL